MPTSSKTKQEPKPRLAVSRHVLLWSSISAGIIVVGLVAVAAVAYAAPGTKIVRAVTVVGQPVGGLDSLTAIHQLETRWAAFQQQAFQFQAAGRTMTILVTADTASEEEVVLGVVDFDVMAAVNTALSFGRRGSWWQRVLERTSGWLGRRHEFGQVTVDGAMLGATIQDKFSDLEKPAKNATLKFVSGDTAEVVASAKGTTFDYTAAARQVVAEARQLSAQPITIKTIDAVPAIASSSALNALVQQDLKLTLDRAPLTLTRDDKKWTISRDQLKKILGFAGTTTNPRLGFDAAATADFLGKIAADVNVKAKNAKFSIVDGRVKEFQASGTGIALDIPATIAAMQIAFFDQQQTMIALVVTEEQPMTDTVATNKLGITELVGEATTNFRGSPANRRFNLSYGAELLNGLLIQPGEEFSLVKALGKIDAAHGWKSELVIKGTKITPEYGGGLCQVGTTMFRVALNTGLPIVERHNHSLRISYYEPPIGLDATIYEPKPDLRFTNDYTTPLLLQTKVDGNLLTFSFYSTKDGRTVDIPTPKVYNRVGIPATKNIEVDDLKPGEKKCQAPGHPGADATATYTVTKADGTKVTQTFQSHYRAIGIICQVGKKAVSKPAPTPVPEPVVNTNTVQ